MRYHIGVYSLTSPEVVPVDSPPSEFSAERAMKHISVIAQEPHPVGSPENEQVANYIVTQLESLGISFVIDNIKLEAPSAT